eukprot:TRINITY_DN12196_c0_g1_i1.p1 TRINITY_DN12196_c0_g1~~TRINITY_DN12196_c0_g1_i1.p1  ORF type:complete len:305 (+),score=38.93 TRINITY_DN12196_c0_g1_i1:42-956(+)
MAATQVQERNQDATVYVGDLDQQVNETLLWELMLQAGPVVNVHIPRDKLSGGHMGYGFVEFHSEEDADYGIKIMNMIKLYGKPIRVNKASRDRKTLDVGANIFVGNLDPEVDNKLLYDSFSQFGVILMTPKIMREGDGSRGYAFISYDSFEASDAAIEAMNGQYLCNRPITVTYAFKKGTKGERHGSQAERLLAANNPNRGIVRPPMFAPGMRPDFMPPVMPPGMPPAMPGMPPALPPGMPPGMPPVMPPGMPRPMPPPGMPPGMPPPMPGMPPVPPHMMPPGMPPGAMPPGMPPYPPPAYPTY